MALYLRYTSLALRRPGAPNYLIEAKGPSKLIACFGTGKLFLRHNLCVPLAPGVVLPLLTWARSSRRDHHDYQTLDL